MFFFSNFPPFVDLVFLATSNGKLTVPAGVQFGQIVARIIWFPPLPHKQRTTFVVVVNLSPFLFIAVCYGAAQNVSEANPLLCLVRPTNMHLVRSLPGGIDND